MKKNNTLSRRDFLKLAPLVTLPLTAQPLDKFGKLVQSNSPNIIILVLDAWAAGHVPIYGYPRNTMPNLEQFADNALVFHNHYSAGTFTATGAASLLTGLYPWEHRAYHIRSGIRDSQVTNNLFSALISSHNTVGYSQNKYADKFLYQFDNSIQTHIRQGAFNLQSQSIYDLPLFKKDGLISFASFDENIFHKVGDYDSSLFLGPIFRTLTLYKRKLLNANYQNEYPKGLPDSTELFLLDDLVEGTIDLLDHIEQPGLLYLHYYPPHWPYQPTGKFQKFFRNDGYQPAHKSIHPLADAGYDPWSLNDFREKYDSFLASWDDSLGRLFNYLHESGLMENSYIFITSDHGEMFERGISGHTTPLIFDPLIHIPLLVSLPGQLTREDIFSNTSSLDLLPTIAHLCGHAIPAWAQGELLPGFGTQASRNRSIFTLDAKDNSAFKPLTEFSLSLTKAGYRLTHYNYPQYQGFEFYNLEDDPAELKDLYPSQPAISREIQQELLDTISDVNKKIAGEVSN
jgi:arylsulfatase A-like enzyme